VQGDDAIGPDMQYFRCCSALHHEAAITRRHPPARIPIDPPMTRLLIIEDDPALGEMLSLHFEEQGAQVQLADHCATARQRATAQGYDLILLDQQLPDGLGIELLPELQAALPDTPIIMMTGQHDLELAIEAIKQGAADFIHKPIQTTELQTAVDKALARRRVARETHPAPRLPTRDLIGRSSAMLEVSKQIALSAGSDANVLILGESGTGKEVVARLIHQHSERNGPFVALNCAAIVDTLIESELFGHEKGAFTGADRRKPGKFELAAGGTLFLDEIGELAHPLQAKLLRSLQERVIERVGGTESIPVDVRIIAATHHELFGFAAEGRFREDLAYRLKVIEIRLPPCANAPKTSHCSPSRCSTASPCSTTPARHRCPRRPSTACKDTTGRAMYANWRTPSPRPWCTHAAAPSCPNTWNSPPRARRHQPPPTRPCCARSPRSRPNTSSACSITPADTRGMPARSSGSLARRWTARSPATA